jgi:hypothetical protein
MVWQLSFLIALAAGWFLARTLTAGAFTGPRWASGLVEFSLGVLFGPGLASVLCFALVGAGAATQTGILAALGTLLVACAAAWWKWTPPAAPTFAGAKAFPWAWALWICVAAGFVLFFLDFQAASNANPNGEWDAMSIWNLRARYLAAGTGFWQRAVSADIGGHMVGSAHPGYPLFLSGFIALQWISEGISTGAADQMVPIVISFTIAVAAFVLLGSSLASRKSVMLGLLAWCVLLASEVFASQTSAQYSDLLQGLAFLSALILLDAADRNESKAQRLLIAAGLAIGFAGWIKNEGLPFTIAALAVAAWRFRARGLPWLLAGAAPGVLSTAVLKMFVAHGREAIFPATVGEALTKIAGAGRWWQAALGFGKAVFDAGSLWAHPVLLAAVLAFAVRFVPKPERVERLWLWIPIAVTAAAEYGLYLITTADLDWHISTSVSRLVAQLWPSLIWLFFLMLRPPEEYVKVEPVAATPTGNKPKRR